ncbi:MAG: hypothetical protein M0O96_10200 [Desulforhopalus sp.]|nr:hypothetical protein [Desulforhopalus sp.]
MFICKEEGHLLEEIFPFTDLATPVIVDDGGQRTMKKRERLPPLFFCISGKEIVDQPGPISGNQWQNGTLRVSAVDSMQQLQFIVASTQFEVEEDAPGNSDRELLEQISVGVVTRVMV